MGDFLPVLLAVGKLFGVTLLGYLILKPEKIRSLVLKPLLWATINLLLPVYFLYVFGSRWDSAMADNPVMPWLFFIGCIVQLLLQFVMAQGIAKLFSKTVQNDRRGFIALLTFHNAGYIPLPIIQALVDNGILTGTILLNMVLYVAAFQSVFWSLAVAYLSSDNIKHFKLRLNTPIVAVMFGFVMVLTGLHRYIQKPVWDIMKFIGNFSLYQILFILGGILANIPKEKLKLHPSLPLLVIIKNIAMPGLALIVILVISFFADIKENEIVKAVLYALVIEAGVPPATNLMIAGQQFGKEKDMHYIGAGIISTYTSAIITIPLLLILTQLILH